MQTIKIVFAAKYQGKLLLEWHETFLFELIPKAFEIWLSNTIAERGRPDTCWWSETIPPYRSGSQD
jgi:hypothetical protein